MAGPDPSHGMAAFDRFEVIPAVDIQDGEAVQLIGGERDTATGYGDPVEAARRWVDAGADILHVVDLDGAFEGRRVNLEAIERLAEAGPVEIQLGGGIRSAEDAIELLDRGIDRVILGTAAIEDPAIVKTVSAAHEDGVMVSLDARDGEVVVEGWTEGTGLDPAEAAARYEGLGASSILFTNVDVEGRLAGVRTAPIERVLDRIDVPLVASGGVGRLEDVSTLADLGASGVVIGRALYEGRFTLEEALAAVA